MTWNEFKTLFKEKFVPEQEMERLHDEIANLQQGDHTIQEYLNRFTQLSRYTPELAQTVKAKNKRFIHGLQRRYQDKEMSHVNLTFAVMVDMA